MMKLMVDYYLLKMRLSSASVSQAVSSALRGNGSRVLNRSRTDLGQDDVFEPVQNRRIGF